MNDHDKYRLIGNQELLVQNLKVNDIQDYLAQECIITDEETENLSNDARHESMYAAARRLLAILKKSSEPNCYIIFCDALRKKGYEYIVETLEKTDIRKIQDRLQREQRQKDDQVEKLNKQVWMQNEMLVMFKQELDGVKEKVSAYTSFEQKLKEKGLSIENVPEMLMRYMEKGGFSPPPEQKLYYPSKPAPPRGVEVYKCQSEEESDYHTVKEDTVDVPIEIEINQAGDAAEDNSLARIIGKDIAFYLVAKKEKLQVHDPPNEYAAAMRKMVDDLMDLHEDMFEQTLRDLDLNKVIGFEAIMAIFDELFRDNQTNWGRIVALYAYGGYMAMNSGFNIDDKDSWHKIATMGDFLGYYVDEKLSKWIEEQGGWVSFPLSTQIREEEAVDSSSTSYFTTTSLIAGATLFWAGYNTVSSGFDPSYYSIFRDVLLNKLGSWRG